MTMRQARQAALLHLLLQPVALLPCRERLLQQG